MQNFNHMIKQTRFSLPVIDDLFVDLSNETFFSKLSLNSAFYQLKLDTKTLFILQPFGQKLRLRDSRDCLYSD